MDITDNILDVDVHTVCSVCGVLPFGSFLSGLKKNTRPIKVYLKFHNLKSLPLLLSECDP